VRTRVAINGFGRIGRQAFKLALERDDLEIAAINDIGDVANMAYLLKYDSVYRTDTAQIEAADGTIIVDVVDGNLVKVFAWYDNEWGYSNRLVEAVALLGASIKDPVTV
jgi:glyceraldehyde 3-phosphate dehydrogenase